MCHAHSSLPSMSGLRAPASAPAASPGLRRGSGPEIFTFDPLPERAAAPAARLGASRGHRKRNRKVLYPRVQVRRQPPAEDPNPAKRLLFLLLAVVFCQILMAEEGVSTPLASEDAPRAASPAPPALEPLNLTMEPSDFALDLSTFLQQHPAAF